MSDGDLVSAATRLAAAGRETTADLIALLAALDARKVYAAEGYSSIFAFCLARLKLSEEEAYYRIAAARAASRFPGVLDRLRAGRLTLTNLALLRKHLTAENHARLLHAAEGQSKRAVQRLVATLAPLPDVPASLRRLPRPRPVALATNTGPAQAGTLRDAGGAESVTPAPPEPSSRRHDALLPVALASSTPLRPIDAARSVDSTRDACASAPPPARPAAIRPLSPARYSLQVTVSEATHQKLRRARDLLRHAVPDGDLSEVLDRALTLLLAELERKKFGATKPTPKTKPEATTPSPARRRRRLPTSGDPGVAPTLASETAAPASAGLGGASMPRPRSRYIPAAVRRAVWLRDEGRCRFVGPHGRCGETGRLEFHHLVPFADGGPPTASNTELRCTIHNEHEARRWFGEEVTAYRKRRARDRHDGYPGRP